MHLCIPVILEQNHIGVSRLFSAGKSEMQCIFGGTDGFVPCGGGAFGTDESVPYGGCFGTDESVPYGVWCVLERMDSFRAGVVLVERMNPFPTGFFGTDESVPLLRFSE